MQDDNVWTGGNPIDWVDIMFIQFIGKLDIFPLMCAAEKV
jgi:hypothetical protein